MYFRRQADREHIKQNFPVLNIVYTKVKLIDCGLHKNDSSRQRCVQGVTHSENNTKHLKLKLIQEQHQFYHENAETQLCKL